MADPVELWCAALESGEYKQGRFHLNFNGEYCCLGVLCELAVKEDIVQHFNGMDAVLPLEVMRWAGLATSSGVYDDTNLTFNNDVEYLPFPEIAAIIRSRPRGLFNNA